MGGEGLALGTAQEREREVWNWKAEGVCGEGVTKGSKIIKFANKGRVQNGAKENRAGGWE